MGRRARRSARAKTETARGSAVAVEQRTFYRLADEPREIVLIACSKCEWKATFRRDGRLTRNPALVTSRRTYLTAAREPGWGHASRSILLGDLVRPLRASNLIDEIGLGLAVGIQAASEGNLGRNCRVSTRGGCHEFQPPP